MPRICVIALIGLPAAGKTTFCQHLLALQQLPFNVAHVCFDHLMQINAIDLESLSASQDFSMKTERLKILRLLETTIEAIRCYQFPNAVPLIPTTCHDSEDYVILCDDNHYYTSMRYKIYQLCKANQAYFAQIYIPIDLTKSLERNAIRDIHMRVPRNVIEKMFVRFEAPNSTKSHWESMTLIADCGMANCDSASAIFINFVNKVFQNAIVATSTESTTIKQQNFSPLHHLDVLLRRRIKNILENSVTYSAAKKNNGNRLNLIRKEILQRYSKCTASEIESLNFEKLNDICKLLN